MATNDAVIVFFDDDSPQFSLYRTSTGTPEMIAALLTTVLAGYRRTTRRTLSELIPRVIAAEGYRASRHWKLYPDRSAASHTHAFRYELRLEPRSQLRIRVLALIDNSYHEKYAGYLEPFLSKALRRRMPAPRGRTPKGYDTRAEYELAFTARKAANREADLSSLPNEPWQESVRREQRSAPLPNVPPDARIYTKAEALARLRGSARKKR